MLNGKRRGSLRSNAIVGCRDAKFPVRRRRRDYDVELKFARRNQSGKRDIGWEAADPHDQRAGQGSGLSQSARHDRYCSRPESIGIHKDRFTRLGGRAQPGI